VTSFAVSIVLVGWSYWSKNDCNKNIN